MLKIRDDVDLKELKKFGFVKKKDYYELNFAEMDGLDGFVIRLDDRQIENYSVGDDTSIETLYDLIKANLVVKE